MPKHGQHQSNYHLCLNTGNYTHLYDGELTTAQPVALDNASDYRANGLSDWR